MATVIVGELYEERRGSEQADGNVREYTRAFLVESDNQYDGQRTVLSTAGLPQKYVKVYDTGTGTESDPGARVVNLEAEPHEGHWNLWKVTVKYSSKWYDEAKNDPDPMARPAIRSWSTLKYQKPAERDIDDEAITNSAYETFDPPPSMNAHRLQLRIQKNYDHFDFKEAAEYLNSVNELEFNGFDPGQVLLEDISSQEKYENESVYDEVTFTFAINKDGWKIVLLDQGYSEINPLTGEIVPIMNRGAIPSRPVLLDGGGLQLDISTEDPFYLPGYQVYPTKNFEDLDIPS